MEYVADEVTGRNQKPTKRSKQGLLERSIEVTAAGHLETEVTALSRWHKAQENCPKPNRVDPLRARV